MPELVSNPVKVEVAAVDEKLAKDLKRATAPIGPTGLRAQDQEIDPSVPARTTYQEDLVASGQRQINLIWERTQAAIAVGVVACNMMVATFRGITGSAGEHPVILSSSLFLIIGFYFSRTNHSAIGGVGKKPAPEMPYTGR